MKRFKCCFLGLVTLIAVGCDDSSSSNNDDVCTKNTCVNSTTLNVCNDGTPQAERCPENEICNIDHCEPLQLDNCKVNICKNNETLMVCTDGTYHEENCGPNKVCNADQCTPITDSQTCSVNECKNSTTQKVCSEGVFVEHPCGENEVCSNGDCIADPNKCTAHICTEEMSNTYHACVNGNVSAELSQCAEGTACLYGSCVANFEEGANCDDEEGVGYCTADKQHAVVCNAKNKLAIWTCADECLMNGNIVDCPKTPRPKPHECEKDYRAECINNNAQVKVCVDYQLVTWDCYGNTCSVDDNNTIYCPRTAGLAGLGGLESGGTYGDECNVKKYQEACIDNYYARICDKDGIVRIKPAGDCKTSASNPLKVEYTMAADCDASDYMPFCINDGKAIGFCAYDNDLSIEIYKAAQCPSCQSQEDANHCMLL